MRKVKAEGLRPQYERADLGKGIRGKHLTSYRKGTNLVLLSPDVAEAFPTEKAVNEVLRSLISIARKSIAPTTRPVRRTKRQHAG